MMSEKTVTRNSGKITITGVRSVQEADEVYEGIVETLKEGVLI